MFLEGEFVVYYNSQKFVGFGGFDNVVADGDGWAGNWKSLVPLVGVGDSFP
jgi:hypothetical protein